MALERRAHTRPSPARERPLGAWGLTPRRGGGPPRWRGSLGRGPGWRRRRRECPSAAAQREGPRGVGTYAATSRRAAAVARKPRARARVEPPRVQILVVVANIQTRALKAEVEKGSMCTAVQHGSVGPKG